GDELSIASAREKSFSSAANAFEHLRNYIDELQEKRLVEIDAFSVQIESDLETSSTKLLILVVLATLVCGLATYFLPALVAEQVRQISDRIQNIAEGDGDLRVRLPVNTNDEL